MTAGPRSIVPGRILFPARLSLQLIINSNLMDMDNRLCLLIVSYLVVAPVSSQLVLNPRRRGVAPPHRKITRPSIRSANRTRAPSRHPPNKPRPPPAPKTMRGKYNLTCVHKRTQEKKTLLGPAMTPSVPVASQNAL